MTATSCMGGWACERRNRCAHHVTEDRSRPVERLCEPNRFDSWAPIREPRRMTWLQEPAAQADAKEVA